MPAGLRAPARRWASTFRSGCSNAHGNAAAPKVVTNVRYEHADTQVHEFEPRAFDLAISRFGAMFFGDPVAAFANVGGVSDQTGESCCSHGARSRRTSG